MEKAWYQSRTIWGGIITAGLSASGIALNFDPATGDFSGNIYQIWQQAGTLIAGLLVMYGRTQATAPIKSTRRKK